MANPTPSLHPEKWMPPLLTLLRRRVAAALIIASATILMAGQMAVAAPSNAGIAPVLAGPTKSSTGSADTLLLKALKSQLIQRARSVDVDLMAMESLSVHSQATSALRTIRVPFFDDASMLIEFNRTEPTSSGGIAYVGKVAGEKDSLVVLVNNAGTLSLNVFAAGDRYALHGSRETGFIATQKSRLDLPDHPLIIPSATGEKKTGIANSPSATAKPTPLPSTQQKAGSPLPSKAKVDDGSTIDVMVVYTPAAKLAQTPGTTAQMHANIDAQVAITNAIYSNSNVVQRLRLAYKGEISYSEVNMNTDLARILNPADGYLDELHLLRDLYGADIVSFWGVYGDYCGLSVPMTDETDTNNATRAYNVVASPICTSGTTYTFAHELGHSMGLRHDHYVESGTNVVTPEAGGAPSGVDYAHGYVDLTNRFRTVMSLNDQCVNTFGTAAPTFGCPRIPYFSNPGINYQNSVYPPAVLATTGNVATAFEAQALNDTRETTANFRAGLASLTGPGIVAFLPSSYSVLETVGNVTLYVGRHVGSTGSISVTYATADGTASAGSDYSSTSGTLSWVDGETGIKTITVPITQDSALEGRETFSVVLGAATGGASIGSAGGATTTAVVSIVDVAADTFPSGGVVPIEYVQATPALAWSVDFADGYLSSTSLHSAQVLSTDGSNMTYANSDLEYTGNFDDGNVSFAYRVSSLNSSSGNLEFYIDGVLQLSSAGGDTGWLTTSHAISAGAHTLKWRFRNRQSAPCASAAMPPPNCQDRAWIDQVALSLSGSMLSVLKSGSGTGIVVGAGISCGPDCNEVTAPGTMISLTAVADATSSFEGWSGGGCSGTGSCNVTMTNATNVTATFKLLPEVFPANCMMPAGWITPAAAYTSWAVTTDRARSGSCSLRSMPLPNASASGFANAAKAQIQVADNFSVGSIAFRYNVSSEAGYDCLRFYVDNIQRSELGNCDGAGGNGGLGASGEVSSWTLVSIPVSAGSHTFMWSYEKNDSVTAGNDAAWIDDVMLPPPAPVLLTVAKSGTGTGTITGNGINCGADCSENVTPGTVITLTATPANGAAFVDWTGGGCMGSGACVVTVNSATTVTATFVLATTAPGAPTINGILPGNTVATIAFTPSGSDGGSPITGYSVQCTAISHPTQIKTGPGSPITVGGLTNDIAYSCGVSAVNLIGAGIMSATLNVTPSPTAPLVHTGVVSRKMHAGIAFDLPITLGIAPNGDVNVEPRSIGAGHQIVFQFNNTVTAVGTAYLLNAMLNVLGNPPAAIGANNTEVVVTLTGIPDRTRAAIALTDVNGTVSAQVTLGFLRGDITGSRSVNAADISAVKARIGSPVSTNHFVVDVNADGAVTAADLSAVRANSGNLLP